MTDVPDITMTATTASPRVAVKRVDLEAKRETYWLWTLTLECGHTVREPSCVETESFDVVNRLHHRFCHQCLQAQRARPEPSGPRSEGPSGAAL